MLTIRALLTLAAALLAAVAVLCAHYAYYLWPVGSDRLWAKYVGDGFGFALACLAVVLQARGEVGALLVAAGLWGAIEGLQQGVCGLASWGTESAAVDLCIARIGPAPYLLLAGVSAAWLLTMKARNG